MPPPIARTYSSKEAAMAAADELKNQGHRADSVHVVAPSDSDAAAPQGGKDHVMDAVLRAGVPAHAAPVYADSVRKGEALVVVHPFFGKSLGATSVLHSFEPTSTHTSVVEPHASAAPHVNAAAGNAAPLSRLLGWPVLSSNPAPFSTWLKWPLLKREPAKSRTLEAIRHQSGDAAPLSRKFGLRLLSKSAAPLSNRFRWRLLSKSPAPLSSRLNWRVLSDDPAPFSRLLGLRVLTKHKSRPARSVRYL